MKYIFLNTQDINVWNNLQNSLDAKRKGFSCPRSEPTLSLNYAVKLFGLIEGNVIAECGTGLHGEKSGNSILYWFNKTKAKEIHCIDLRKEWVNSIEEKFGGHDRVVCHQDDCLKVVPNIKNIDLLYMDFWADDGDSRARAYLDLYEVSNRPEMILIDDTDHSNPWKQTLIVPAAVSQGYRIIYTGRQTLLVRDSTAKKHKIDKKGCQLG